MVNAPVYPLTRGGDFVIDGSLLLFSATQDGMEYAILNSVTVPIINPTQAEIEQLNNLREATYQTSGKKGEFGFKFGAGYRFPCDGWDLTLSWLRFAPLAQTQVEATSDSEDTLITLWSSFASTQGSITYARCIESFWKLNLNQVDLDLGRAFWASRRLSMRPHLGLRFASIRQKYTLEQLGGSWSPRVGPDQLPLNNEVKLQNTFQGTGLESGLETNWHFGCGFSLFGSAAGSIVYGSFSLKQDEENRIGLTPHNKTKILEIKDHFRVSRPIFDYAIGIEYTARFVDNTYAFSGKLLWEEHLYFDQNQLFRIQRVGNTGGSIDDPSGENIHIQRRGTLDIKGISLQLSWAF